MKLNQLHKEIRSSSSDRKHKRHRIENADQDDEKSSQAVFKCSQEPNGSIGSHSHAGDEDGSEKHKKNKKKYQEVECRDHGDIRVEFRHRVVKVRVTQEWRRGRKKRRRRKRGRRTRIVLLIFPVARVRLRIQKVRV